uniref:Aminoacyl-transfer RNA synthetases class-II family profile domain-containing protein n=1 Tax=Timema monikensis TaxID=170555 RepID=A0A7R9HNL4_9NEOP|nr:unnamed protein product [Timema monikensis]
MEKHSTQDIDTTVEKHSTQDIEQPWRNTRQQDIDTTVEKHSTQDIEQLWRNTRHKPRQNYRGGTELPGWDRTTRVGQNYQELFSETLSVVNSAGGLVIKCICRERRHNMVFPCFSSNTSLHGVLAPRPFSSTCADKTQPVPENVNKFSERTHTCGELRVSHVGQEVRLCGWLEYERMGKFLTLRDGYGSIQLVVTDSVRSFLSPTLSPQGRYWGQSPRHSALHPQVDSPRIPCLFQRDDITALLEGITYESVLAKMSTGDIEVLVSEVFILNKAKKNLPFGVRDHNKAKEYLRMKYRYLDLRFPRMQRNLRLRSHVIMKMRQYLCNYCDFVDVETPTLFRRTPGGAQEFVVPTRLAGQFYSLVQSPQQFKQLLMVGGLDRYFQIARCYRDEGSRPDRQPEFTQLDIEMSFSNREGVLSLVQELLEYCWPEHLDRPSTSYPRMTYRQAMEDYGTDKPDTRFSMKVCVACSAYREGLRKAVSINTNTNNNYSSTNSPDDYSSTNSPDDYSSTNSPDDYISTNSPDDYISTNSPDDYIREHRGNKRTSKNNHTEQREGVLQNVSDLVRFDDESKLRAFSSRPDCTAHLTSLKSKLQNAARRQFPLTRLISCSSSPGAHWREQLAGIFSADCVKALEESLDVHQEDALLVGVGSEQQVLESRGLRVRESGFHFLWVVDFPLFVAREGALESTHHPFTHPHPDDVHLLRQQPLKVRSLHYDLVLNGCEVGGGSVRIHDPLLQGQVLDYLGVDRISLQHLLDALSSGCPPHAGIALGLDRLLSLICHAASIRDVIAFPKTLEGRDPMSGAPVPISEQEQKLYHIRSLEPMDDTCVESAQ